MSAAASPHTALPTSPRAVGNPRSRTDDGGATRRSSSPLGHANGNNASTGDRPASRKGFYTIKVALGDYINGASGSTSSPTSPKGDDHPATPTSPNSHHNHQGGNNPSIREINQWLSGSKYNRYDIERSKLRAVNAAARAAANHHHNSASTMNGSTTTGALSSPTATPKPASAYSKINIGAGVRVTASKNLHRSVSGGAARGPTTAGGAEDASAGSPNSNTSGGKAPVKPLSAYQLSPHDADAAAARTRLIERRDVMQQALDSRGSQYVSKVGKLSSTWMMGEDRRSPMKASMAECLGKSSSSPTSSAPNSRRGITSGGNSTIGNGRISTISSGSFTNNNNNASSAAIPPMGDNNNASLTNTMNSLMMSGTFGGGASANPTSPMGTSRKPATTPRAEGADGGRISPALVRQYLGSSFAAVHLSNNSNTQIVMHPQHPANKNVGPSSPQRSTQASRSTSPMPSPKRPAESTNPSPHPEGAGGGADANATADPAAASTMSNDRPVSPALSLSQQLQQSLGGTLRSGSAAASGRKEGIDIGAVTPAVSLQKSSKAPADPIHGGCFHTQQQQPRLFPALLGPYTNPNYYVRKDGAVLDDLQHKKDRPSSHTRHGNPQGIPNTERPFKNDHDIEATSRFRVCGPDSRKPIQRSRDAGPPHFYSPGTSAAATRTYVSSNPLAYTEK